MRPAWLPFIKICAISTARLQLSKWAPLSPACMAPQVTECLLWLLGVHLECQTGEASSLLSAKQPRTRHMSALMCYLLWIQGGHGTAVRPYVNLAEYWHSVSRLICSE